MITKCPACQQEVPPEAARCIRCGFPFRQAREKHNPSWRWLGIVLLMLGAAGIVGGFNAARPSEQQPVEFGRLLDQLEQVDPPRIGNLRVE